MKRYGLLFVFVCLYFFQTYSQIDTIKVLVTTFVEKNYVVPENSVLVNYASISIRDTLFVYGKLINNGTIQTQNCIVKNGELHSTKSNNLLINNNLHLSDAITSSADTINEHIISFSANNIYIDGNTEMKSAYLTTNNLYIHSKLVFSGKLGVKTIKNDFIIREDGELFNLANENIQLYGNAYNYSEKQCENANFELYGIDKGFYGNFSCYRFDLEENTIYTNYGELTITNIFSGKGKLIQAENSYLKIQSETSSEIQATAIGNTLEYTRGGEQILKTDECYNLIISKNGDNFLSLSRNLTIHNTLTIKKKSYLNCNGFQVSFPQATENSIVIENTKNNKGIILNNGHISIENLDSEQQLYVPLYTNDTTFAAIKITNNNETPITFNIDSCFHFVTKNGKSIAKRHNTDFVNLTWHIQSDDNYQITLYWNTPEELYIFDKKACTIYQSDGTQWNDIECEIGSEFSSTNATADGYYAVGNKTIILPIILSHFYANTSDNCIHIHWKLESNADKLFLEKSYDGLHFTQIAEFPTNTKSNIYKDVFEYNNIVYYRLVLEHKGKNDYSHIICISDNTEEHLSITRNDIIFSSNLKIQNMLLYNTQGKIVKNSNSNTLSISDIQQGVYLLHIIRGTETIIKKIAIL